MRWLSHYLRQCFCIHDFDRKEANAVESWDDGNRQSGVRVSLICRKCGYHRAFWKW